MIEKIITPYPTGSVEVKMGGIDLMQVVNKLNELIDKFNERDDIVEEYPQEKKGHFTDL